LRLYSTSKKIMNGNPRKYFSNPDFIQNHFG
jgi:hypothetical protein